MKKFLCIIMILVFTVPAYGTSNEELCTAIKNLLALLPCEEVTTNTYYIDYANGSDANNGKSISTPWKLCPGMVGFTGTYIHAVDDKFIFKGGSTWPSSVFPLTIANAGIVGHPDIYTGGQLEPTPWGSGYPVFDGEDVGAYASGFIKNSKDNKDYWTLNGIKIIRAGNITYGNGSAILMYGGSGITISNNWLETNSVNALAYGSDGIYSDLTITGNIIKKAGRVHISGGNGRLTNVIYSNNTHYGGIDYDPKSYHNDGLMIGGSGETEYSIKGLYIYNNKWIGDWSRGATAQLYLNGSSEYCYDYINGSHEPTPGQVALGETSKVGSKIYSVTNTGGWTGSGTGTICGSGSTLLKGENLKEYDVYGGNFIGILSSSSTHISKKSTQDVYIYNNLFTTDNIAGNTLSPGMIYISGGHDNIKVYNNTIDSRSNLERQPSHCIMFGIFVSNIEVKNNILAGAYNGITASMWSGTLSIDNNLFYTKSKNNLIWNGNIPARWSTCAQIQAQGYGTSFCDIADPLIATLPSGGIVGSGDWRLQPNSPAINKGLDLSPLFTTDINGKIRPIGAWDIGAYEN